MTECDEIKRVHYPLVSFRRNLTTPLGATTTAFVFAAHETVVTGHRPARSAVWLPGRAADWLPGRVAEK